MMNEWTARWEVGGGSWEVGVACINSGWEDVSMGDWVTGWLGGWMAGWLDGWVAGWEDGLPTPGGRGWEPGARVADGR